MKSIGILAVAGTLLAATCTVASAENALFWAASPHAAFVDAYVYACQPVEYDFGGAKETLSEAAREVHTELFLAAYNGSCRNFYFGEVVPRLDAEMQPFFLPFGW